MSLHRIAFVFLILCSGAQAQTLSLQRARELALVNQPLLAGMQASIVSSEQARIAAGQLPDPKLKVGLANLPVTGTDGWRLTPEAMTQRSVGISQEFTREEKRRLKGERFRLEAERDRSELGVIRRQVERDAALAWLEVFYPDQALSLLRRIETENRLQLDSLMIGYRAGRVTQAEVLAAEVALKLLADRGADFQAQAARARAGLSRWIGADADRPVSADLPQLATPADIDALVAHIAAHPHLSYLGKQVEMAEAETALARQSARPDWNVEVSYSQRGPAFSDMVSVQFGIDLPLWRANRQDRDVASKAALIDKARALREEHLRALQSDVRRFHADWRSSTERAGRFERDILPQARDRVEAALAAYSAGRGDIAPVLDARRALLDINLQRLALQMDAARAQLQLQYFTE
jgi:cobalt-zinc-cadmium efflux system outer membrane protein